MSKTPRRGASRRELLAVIERLEKRIAELEAEVARLRKDSSTSSKPPSSDIVKKPSPAPKSGQAGKRNIGGQPGHPKHERKAFSPEQIDAVWEYALPSCPDCGDELRLGRRAPRVVQQVEFVDKPVRIEEHRALSHWCARCRRWHCAPLPAEVERGGLFGPRLTAHAAYLKGACHASYSVIREYLREAMGIEVSRGYLAKLVQKASRALAEPHGQLLASLPAQSVLNVDETGHKENKAQWWTWCFRAKDRTVFKIAPSRGSRVLEEVLGEQFAGTLGCDYFSAYRKYIGKYDVRVQFCLAHLIRDIKFLATLSHKETRAYGERLLGEMHALFHAVHRREKMGKNAYKKALLDRKHAIREHAIRGAPQNRHAQAMAKRFEKHGEAYFQFIATPGIEPTNNPAEQAIRFVVLDRHVTQGTRGAPGRQWCERIWTVRATCHAQQRSVHHYLAQAVQALFNAKPAPALPA